MLACLLLPGSLSLASGGQHLQISGIFVNGLGQPSVWASGYFVEISIGGHVAIKTKIAIFDPINKVFRMEGVWSIPGGRGITPAQISILLFTDFTCQVRSH